MKKHIGIFVDSRRNSGGAYHELLCIIKNFEKYDHNFKISIIFSNDNLDIDKNKFKFNVLFLNMNSFDRYFCQLTLFNKLFKKIKNYLPINNKFENLIKNNNINLVYFAGPSQYALYLENTKYFITVPDVSHRENLEFPELINNSEFERREEILSKTLPKAIAVITNASIIKKRINFFYKVLNKRIVILNHQPSIAVDSFELKKNSSEDILKKFDLNKNFLFYPAMYFPHKNHKTLISALEKLKDKNIILDLVCCGNDNGYLQKLKDYTLKKEMNNQIKFLNYVDDEDLPYLYLNASVLIMTSLIGPTNIPPWEAFRLGIPVIYPKLEGIEEVYEDCVLYYNQLDDEDLAEKIQKILQDENLKKKLIIRGSDKLNKIKDNHEFYRVIEKLNDYFLIEEL